MKQMNFIFASHPSVYTLPGTWETQPDILYNPLLLMFLGSSAFAIAAVVSIIAIKRKRKKI
tara:strand:+ start:259 stop:441 length:183 start_codon:yes stop_codon:yes gene_type:complete